MLYFIWATFTGLHIKYHSIVKLLYTPFLMNKDNNKQRSIMCTASTLKLENQIDLLICRISMYIMCNIRQVVIQCAHAHQLHIDKQTFSIEHGIIYWMCSCGLQTIFIKDRTLQLYVQLYEYNLNGSHQVKGQVNVSNSVKFQMAKWTEDIIKQMTLMAFSDCCPAHLQRSGVTRACMYESRTPHQINHELCFKCNNFFTQHSRECKAPDISSQWCHLTHLLPDSHRPKQRECTSFVADAKLTIIHNSRK